MANYTLELASHGMQENPWETRKRIAKTIEQIVSVLENSIVANLMSRRAPCSDIHLRIRYEGSLIKLHN